MSILHGVVGRVDEKDSRYYVRPSDGRMFESVTTIIGTATAKPWLAPWAAKLAAEYSVSHYQLIGAVMAESSPEGAVALIKSEAQRRRDIARDIGTYCHDVIEALILDAPIPSIPDHLAAAEVDGEMVDLDAIIDGFLNFCEDHDPEFEMAEATVASEQGWAGTADIIATLRRMNRRLLIDAKTGANVDPAVRAQLAAYRACDSVWIDHMGNTAPMPQVDGAAVLHLRRDFERGYKLIDLWAADADYEADLAWFRDMFRTAAGHRARTKVGGRVLYRPLEDGSQPPPLIEDLDGLGRAQAPLVKAGFRTLADVAALTDAQLLAVQGLGPKTTPLVHAILAQHGLALSKGVA